MKIPAFLHRFSSPKIFHQSTGRFVPWLLAGFLATAIIGIYQGLWVAPPDYEQGESYRIIYVHVPAAWLSMFVYMVMAVSSAIFLIWRIKLADVIALASAPLGAAFTALALATGSIWGKPMWGTWWQWDARLTSELVLLFLYLGYIALRAAIEDRQAASRAGAVLALVGVVNIPIIHYSVEWWNTLHQGSTITRFDKPAMAPEMLWPLLLMAISFKLLFFSGTFIAARGENLRREAHSGWARAAASFRMGFGPLLLVIASLVYVGWQASQPATLAVMSEEITVRGTVQNLVKQENETHFVLQSEDTQTAVYFAGKASRYLIEGKGAEVQGTLKDDHLQASRVVGMNLNDYSDYLLSSFLLALLTALFIVFYPLQQERNGHRAVRLRGLLD